MLLIKKSLPLYPAVGVVAVFCICIISPCLGVLPYYTRSTKNGKLRFLVVGDWGREGTPDQIKVATQMGKVGEDKKIDFVISTGDNFYENGLADENDPTFSLSFTDVYTAPSLKTLWYIALGNHDHLGDVQAQLIANKRDPRWFCFGSYVLTTHGYLADFFFLDTTPMVDAVDNARRANDEGHIRGIKQPLNELKSALRRSYAKWKIVVGHHPLKSAGSHGNTEELTPYLLPILTEYKVDIYMNGHDHCLQHIVDPHRGIHFITSGGGSSAWTGGSGWWSHPHELKLYHDGQGFVFTEITQGKAEFIFYDGDGNVLHEFNIVKRSPTCCLI